MLPSSPCHVCVRASSQGTLCPDRADDCDAVYALCTLCLDEFLPLFPLTARKLRARELGVRQWWRASR